ncbi:hypothetical protein KFL_002000150 [Klebsormidium nitens]|uniref:ABC transporter domain-containing protein n=1 Tax=Klebsormidium nitens TaxID=105231 RepID=A0A1Y1I5I5_KLENI|nr:hypothetical protein KFL_002000150 [Klebsormidium nitens]|eukprot:GAQ84679.1 hypothetical protein KFL_002000150 [Klebsormidium nitens]
MEGVTTFGSLRGQSLRRRRLPDRGEGLFSFKPRFKSSACESLPELAVAPKNKSKDRNIVKGAEGGAFVAGRICFLWKVLSWNSVKRPQQLQAMGGGEESIVLKGAADESQLASSWHHVEDDTQSEAQPQESDVTTAGKGDAETQPDRMTSPLTSPDAEVVPPNTPENQKRTKEEKKARAETNNGAAETARARREKFRLWAFEQTQAKRNKKQPKTQPEPVAAPLTPDVEVVTSREFWDLSKESGDRSENAVEGVRKTDPFPEEDASVPTQALRQKAMRDFEAEEDAEAIREALAACVESAGAEAASHNAAAILALEKSKARLAKKAADLASLRAEIQAYAPGAKLLPAGDKTKEDYVIPQKTVLLLVGDMGAGKSTLVNNIHRAVHDTRTDLDIAATASSSTGSHSLLLQEYSITPRLLVFDTRGLSVGNTGENVGLLKEWVQHGVADSQAVIRSSDGQESREAIQDRVRRHQRAFRRRRVNFAIYVVNAAAVHSAAQRVGEERRVEAQRMRSIYSALHQFKDYSPIVVMTHGDQLSPGDRDRARLLIAETLGVDAGDSVFDIASFTGREQEDDELDPITDAALLSMLQQALKLADRSLPPIDETRSVALSVLATLSVLVGLYIAHTAKGLDFVEFIVVSLMALLLGPGIHAYFRL